MQRPPLAIAALGVFATLAALLPLGYLLIRLFAGFEKAIAELLRVRTLELLVNTLLLTFSVTITAMLIGFLQAWLTTRTNLFGVAFFAVLGTLPLAIPSYVLALAYTSVFPGFNGFFAAWVTLLQPHWVQVSPTARKAMRIWVPRLGWLPWQTLSIPAPVLCFCCPAPKLAGIFASAPSAMQAVCTAGLCSCWARTMRFRATPRWSL